MKQYEGKKSMSSLIILQNVKIAAFEFTVDKNIEDRRQNVIETTIYE